MYARGNWKCRECEIALMLNWIMIFDFVIHRTIICNAY